MRENHEFTFTARQIADTCTKKADHYRELREDAQDQFASLIDTMTFPRWQPLLKGIINSLGKDEFQRMGMQYAPDLELMLRLTVEIENNQRAEDEFRRLATTYASQDKPYTLNYSDVLYFGLNE